MAFTEALRLVVDADTRGAVQGINQLGRTADRELSRSEQSLERWGNRLTTVGAGMVALGSVALVGLGAAARASEEANLSVVKLENTLQNMPKLAGESSQQFTDLAASIQDVTAADADAIVEAEALLGTFNLTADEIKRITPLVVDYSRKFGIDMVDAAVQVGKALDGNVGALKRNGVSIDEAAFATDRYGAVQKALADQVGGFAEAEGATFAGSIQRLKNELGDLAEGVGVGAVDAFSTLFGVVDSATGKLNELSPATQNLVGQVATFGSVGLIAAGGVSILIGQAIKMRQNFGDAIGAVRDLTTRMGGLGNAARFVAGPTALLAVGVALDQFRQAQERSDIDALTDEFLAAGTSVKAMNEALSDLAGKGATEVVGAFEKLASTNREAAERFVDQLEAAGAAESVIRQMRDALETTAAAERQTAEDSEGLTGAMGDQAGATEEAKTRLEEYRDTLASAFDPVFGMINAQHGLRDAQINVTEAQAALNEALAGGDPTAIAEAQRNYEDALFGSSEALVDAQSAQAVLNDAVAANPALLQRARDSMYTWAIQAGYSAEQASFMAGQIGVATGAAQALDAQNVDVPIAATDTATPTIRSVDTELENLDGKTANVTVKVTATGQAALNLINQKLLGFASGGVVPGMKGSPQLVLAHGGETILPTHDAASMRDPRLKTALSEMLWRIASGGQIFEDFHWVGASQDVRDFNDMVAEKFYGSGGVLDRQQMADFLSRELESLAAPRMVSAPPTVSYGFGDGGRGGAGGGSVTNLTVNVNAGIGDKYAIATAVAEAVRFYDQTNGRPFR